MDDIAAAAKAPFAATRLAPPTVEAEVTGDGGWLLRQPVPLGELPDHLIGVLREQARAVPDRTFLAERDGAGGWRTLDYAAAAAKSAAIGQALIERGHGPDRPVAILSDNSIDFGLLQLGCMHVSVPVMPVSPAYSLMSRDFAKLKGVIAHHDPSVVFVDKPGPFAAALDALDLDGRTLLTSDGADGSESLAQWAETPVTGALEARLAQVGPDTVAKILLTSGSTGLPKGVINTQRMLCGNQVQTIHAYPFLLERPPVICDWLPWNHTFGGNFCFNLILFHGGTFWLDEGKPAPGLFEKTLANLRAVTPTLYLNVPRGYDVLVRALEADAGLRDRLLGDLDVLFFAGAALPQSLREKLDALSVAARGARTPIVTSLGSTETAPAGTYMTWDSDAWGNIGVPLPGVEVKLAPNGDKLEARFRGPTISPGYWGSPDLTRKAFDEDGYFRIGDAVKFLDPRRPGAGAGLRRPGDGELQAAVGHLGRGRHAPPRGDLRRRAGAAGRGDHRPRPRRDRHRRLSEPARLPRALPGHRGRRGARGRHRAARDPRPPRRRPRRPQRGEPGLVDPHRPRRPDRRAAGDRRGRDHRQGLHQPARGARPPRGRGDAAPRRSAGRGRNRPDGESMMNGAQAIAEILRREGTEFLSCYPRNPLIEACAEIGIRPILCRQERVGVGLADGYSRIHRGRRNGVFAAQAGPGIENAFPGIAQAYSENVPMLILPAGQALARQYRHPTFDASEVYAPVTKWSARAHAVAEVPELMRRAFQAMRTGKGGPVLVEIPAEVWEEDLPGTLDYEPVVPQRAAPDPAALAKAAGMLANAENPVLWAGQGVLYAGASEALVRLAELVPAPVVATNPGKSAMPENHPLACGSSTRSGPRMLFEFLDRADLVLAVGSSLTKTPFGPSIPPGKTIVHSTNDPDDIHKDYRADHALVGDAKLVLDGLIDQVGDLRCANGGARSLAEISGAVAAVKADWRAEWAAECDSDEVPINQYRIIRDLMANVDRDNVIITHDSGSPREQLLPMWETTAPDSYIGWGKSTQLGYSLAVIMGAKLAAPEKLCINVMGDAAIGMTGMDLETAARDRIAILTSCSTTASWPPSATC